MSYYPEPDSLGRDKMKVELDFSNYTSKAEVQKETAEKAKNADLASLKSTLAQLNID